MAGAVKAGVKVSMKKSFADKGKSAMFQSLNKKGGEKIMELETTYSENLPTPSYKTRHFTRTLRESFPKEISKEDFIKAADLQQKKVETLVKNDIARHLEELQKESEDEE